jgi:hypothetical protein
MADPASNIPPWELYRKPANTGNPALLYRAPAKPSTPPSGYAPAGAATPLAYQPGGPNDPAQAARVAAAEAAARAGASTPIETAAQMRLIQARSAAEVATERAKNSLPTNRGQTFDNVAQMRKELEGRNSVQVYKNALPSYASALKSPDTPAGDQDLIYAFAKIMDPNSVVREGEAAGVAALGSMDQQMAGAVRKQLASEGKLTPDLRAQMRNTLANRMGSYNKAYNSDRSFFRDVAKRNGLNADDIIGPHLGDSYAAIENEYFRHDPNKSAAAARAEQVAKRDGGASVLPIIPGSTPSTGDTHSEQMDPKNAALITGLIRSGMPDDKINGVLKDAGIGSIAPEALATARKTITAGGQLTAQYEKPNTLWNKVASSPVGVGIGAAADAGVAGLSDEATAAGQWAAGKGSFGDLLKAADAKKQAAFAADPKASLIGNVAGGAGAMLTGGALADAARVPGLTRMFAGRAAQRALPLIGDMAYGAAYGAGNGNDNRLAGAGAGAVAAGVGNVVGGRIVRGAGGALRGVRNAAVDYLDAAGVPMTGGQILGGTTKAIEDKLTSIPFVGDIIKNRRAEGYNAFNQAAFNEAGNPINATVNGIGDAGLHNLDQATSQAYGNALDGVNVNGNDPAFIGDMQNVVGRAQNLPEPMAGNADFTLRTRIGQGFDNAGNMTGNDFQQSVRGLRRDARAVSDLPYGHDFGEIAQGGEGALEGLLQRQSPGTLPAYRSANAAYRHQSVLDGTINGAAKNQIDEAGNVVFTPAQLNATSVRNGRMFGGQRPFQQLAQSGQQVLPSKIPDSGTAGRAAIGLLAATAGGGAIGGGSGAALGEADKGGAGGASLGLMAGLLNTRAGQRALTTMLLRRPQVAEQAGDWLIQQDPLGRHLGAAFGGTTGGPAISGWLTR